MKIQTVLAAAVICAASVITAAEAFPSAAQLQKKISKQHPRLFLTPEQLPAFVSYVNSPAMKPYLDKVKEQVDKAPDTPRIAANPQTAEIRDGKVTILKSMGNQNQMRTYIDDQSRIGRTAARCAIVYLATGDKKYFKKAAAYIAKFPELLQFCKDNRMMLEWYHTDRLAALMAYDWLYNELTLEQRKAFIAPFVDYSLYITSKPGYITNAGAGRSAGNYGENGLLWHVAIVAMHDGYANPVTLAKIWKKAYKNERETMEYRELMSGGTGLLTSTCTGYCFGYYPNASYNFLHTLKSATGIDGTKYFPQMRDYAKYFDWMTIPGTGVDGNKTLMDFSWGDAYHTNNEITTGTMYTHLAQMIHFFGKENPQCAAEARAMMLKLPEKARGISNFSMSEYPFIPFILTGFDPKGSGEIAKPDTRLGTFIPSFGLAIMRSGRTAQDTYASIKVGAKYDGHQHYDELAFVIFKQGVLTAATGCRDGAPHHQAYYAQTIAHNCPLIRMENEPLPKHWYPRNLGKFDWKTLYCDGGQRTKKVAQNLGFEATDRYVITGGDATKCYSEKKCREAVRQFVYIKPDYFVIYDRLESVKPEQQKVFVLHAQNEPKFRDGIWSQTEFQGRLFTKTLLPMHSRAEVIGGPGKEFWTNNQNFPVGKKIEKQCKERNFLGRYRTEISPAKAENKARFLHVMQASDARVQTMIPAKLVQDTARDGAVLTLPSGEKVQVWFARDGKPEAEVKFLK